jgi:DNA polymerase-1
MLDRLPFRQAWAVDFEFIANRGQRPVPVCMVAQELRSGRKLRLGADQLGSQPPFAITADVLFVAYYASAELTCFKVLGWPMPARILDLYVEFRNATNCLQEKGVKAVESGLLAALAAHGLDTIGAIEKAEMRWLGVFAEAIAPPSRSLWEPVSCRAGAGSAAL